MQENNNNRSFKIVTIVALCVAVLCLSVAYAALTAKLEIRGTAEVQKATWDVHMDESSFNPTTGGNLTYTADETTVSDLHVKFTKPGDSQTLKFKIHNYGDIDAELSSITGTDVGLDKITCTDGSPEDKQKVCGTANDGVGGTVTYTVSYDSNDVTTNGANAVGDKKLAAGSEVEVVITATYLKDIVSTQLPSAAVTVKLPTFVFNYVQATAA